MGFGFSIGRAVALGAAFVLATFSGGAQRVSPATRPVVLDSKSAARLALVQAHPQYPGIAKQNYIQGRVRLQVRVTPEGRVAEAHVIRGHPFLAASALEAVRGWRYRPFETPAGPAEFVTYVEMKFALHTKKIEQIPREPEKDLRRQVRPPEVVRQPPHPAEGLASVRLRVLVDDKGEVIDTQPLRTEPPALQAGRNEVRHWTFRPARWGSLPVPWYLDVDVPVKKATLPGSGGDPLNP